MENYIMYVCPECRTLLKIKGTGKVAKCPKCKDQPFLKDTRVSEEEWKTYSITERNNIIRNLLGKIAPTKEEPDIKISQAMTSSNAKSQSSFFAFDNNEHTENTATPDNDKNKDNKYTEKPEIKIPQGLKENQEKDDHKKKQAKTSGFFVFAIILYIASAIMLFKGIDKMTNYYKSKYSGTNAYVGGDAYNYIINGTYSTSFFVLSMGFLISGTICLGIDTINKERQ